MGPPEFTGGNRTSSSAAGHGTLPGFNGAAGIHRRKHLQRLDDRAAALTASMGPPEFTGGNPRTSSWSHVVALMLQWGRRNSPAETGAQAFAVACVLLASMGPPEFTGGNLLIALQARRRAAASMGPPEFTGGNPCAVPAGSTPTRRASMGPPEFTGGNACNSNARRNARAALQWGRRNSPAETTTQAFLARVTAV